jgi:Ser/Thr protein kinase RdoA (MazF antagonist)
VSAELTAFTARSAVAAFVLPGPLVDLAALPGGHINESFLASVSTPDGPRRYVLQRLNRRVFPRPDLVMENVDRVVAHLARDNRFPVPRLALARQGGKWHTDANGDIWRLMTYVEGTVVRERVQSPAQAAEVGRAFGRFQHRMADFEGLRLRETIPHFHDLESRLILLAEAAHRDTARRTVEAATELDRILAESSLVGVLRALLDSGQVPERIVHNDAKSANVLLDEATGAAVCVIDFDTVMPGTALADFGDMVRSCTTTADEDEADLTRVEISVPQFEGLAEGYLEAAGSTLTARERASLVLAGRWITLEQAARFLTDHLDGDRYYHVEHPHHNLNRARNQFRLFRSLTLRSSELEGIVRNVSQRLGLPQ